jgi:hypothetical protein
MLTPFILQIAGIGVGDAITYGAIILAVIYYATPILIAVTIMLYELLLRLDLGTSMAGAVNILAGIFARKNTSFSVLPTAHKITPDVQSQLFKIDNPLNVFLNVNRGFLYIGFFLSLLTLEPFSLVLSLTGTSFPYYVYTTIFAVITSTLTLEPLFLTTLILLAGLDRIIDVSVDIVKLFRD